MEESQPKTQRPDPFGLAGALLEGKYRVGRIVAEGGFGVVYAGRHTVLDAPVAIKVLKPTPGVEQSHRFAQEAKTIAKLKHPAIVQVLDAGLHGDLAWMVLEWLNGQTLKADLVARRGLGGRSPGDALVLMRPVFEAVAYAHANGVAHRDLKPSNIMLSPSEGGARVHVLDFGVAKAIDPDGSPDTGQTQTKGTAHAFSPRYAAPEQLSGGRSGPWTDIHALSLLLTELLTDASPYASSDPTEIYELAFHADRPSPAKHGVDVGPWRSILERAASLRPAQRFGDVGAFAAALEETLPAAASAFATSPHHARRAATASVPPPASAADTSTASGTGSNTVSVFSTERSHNARRGAKRSRTRPILAAVVVMASISGTGMYLLRGKPPADVAVGASSTAAATATMPTGDPATPPATTATLSTIPTAEAMRPPPQDLPTETPRAPAAPRFKPRSQAVTPASEPSTPRATASAGAALPAYVVE